MRCHRNTDAFRGAIAAERQRDYENNISTVSTNCFGSVIVCERPWLLNASKRNMQLTNLSCRRSLPSASRARSANGKEKLGGATGAMKSLRVSDAPPGAQTSVVAPGNANTSGDLLDRLRNAEPNTTASVLAAPQRGATVRSITSNPVMARDTDQDAITTCSPTALAGVVLRCCVMLTMPRSLRLKQLHVPLHEQMRALRLKPQPKLRSDSWLFETVMDG